MRPFFFGDSSAPLFGVYHPPQGAHPRAWGVVVCNPFGQEYLRAHRALRQLAARLAAAGFHTVRFDYFGCGDSAGDDDEGRVGRWIQDAAAAADEVEALSGSSRLALVGLRLGANVAAGLASRRAGVEQLVLWDPVLDGRRYLEELAAAHETWIREHARARPDGGAPAAAEVLGFPLPHALRAEIEAFDLGGSTCPAPRALVLTSGGADAGALYRSAGPEAVERVRVAGPPVWSRGDGLDESLVPAETLDVIAAAMVRSCG